MPEYLALLIGLAVAVAMVSAALVLSALIGPRGRTSKNKQLPFECGEVPFESPGKPFPVHYYLVAILFLVFDIEVIFLYPWAASFGEVGRYGFLAAMIFLLVLTFGLVYEWLRGGLEWR